MRLGLSGTEPLGLSGTEDSAFRELKSAVSHWYAFENAPSNLANKDSFGIFLTPTPPVEAASKGEVARTGAKFREPKAPR